MSSIHDLARAQDSPDPSSHASNIYDAEEAGGEWLDGDDDDDDMDYEPTVDDSEDAEFFDLSEDTGIDFHDADDGLSGVEIEFALDEEGDNGDQSGNEPEIEAPRAQHQTHNHASPAQIQVTHNQIMQLLGHTVLRNLFTRQRHRDDSYGGSRSRRGQRTTGSEKQFPQIPSEHGRALMNSGTYGSNEYYQDALRKRNVRLGRRLMHRELGLDHGHPAGNPKFLSQDLIPSSNADMIIHYDSRCYSGQFSDDGNFFFSCAQDFKVRMYDTSNPYKWRYYKTVIYPYGQWTITDATLSPNNKYLAYSSIQSIVCLAPTDPGETGEPWVLDFSDMVGRSNRQRFGGRFGVWSIRFSGDGREIVAGASDHSVYVYDIESRKSILRIAGHDDDVNAVCFGDAHSPHILYSGSDDTLIKVWDRRSMGDSREAGVFVGHTEGLTYVDSKGDGRYVLSNGKDQTMKLWDLRRMISPEKASKINPSDFTTGFDYRFMQYSEAANQSHPHDCSLVTFSGHRVLKTLIRCHFSPPDSTNSRYVYTGSEDGSVYIYNLDASLAGKIDVNTATYHSRPKDPDLVDQYELHSRRNNDSWKTCVRDASWHPNAPIIAATSWNGWGMSTGTCTTHSWNDGAEEDEGDPKMGLRVDQRLEENKKLHNNPRHVSQGQSRPRTRLRRRRIAASDDGDEEDV
ncbi:MAG: hypothetical protein LQ342_001030 [Letrouitia transgressa]|nr:MAG: hypothetical protein LQ342_001030 [Letrouitia transgressa]